MTRDLIIVRAGPRSLHGTWLDADTRQSWDLFVCPYRELPAVVPNASRLILGEVIPGPKWTGLRTLLNGWQGWRDYRYIVLADDDLFALPGTWSRFFEKAATYGAKLAAPALADDSYFGVPMTMRNTEFVSRRVSFVENMMPCFRADVLAELLPTLDLTDTGWGWGLDLLWAKLLSYEDILIIDETPVLHTRPVAGGYSPALLQKVRDEMYQIINLHEVPWLLKTLSGIDASGLEMPESDEAFLYRLFRGYASLFRRHPGRFSEIFSHQLEALPQV